MIAALDAPPDFPIGDRTLREVLTDGVSLGAGARHAVRADLLSSPAASGGRRRSALAAGEDPDGDAATLDVLAALHKFPGIRPDPEAFIEALDPLQPRLYSISSSPKADPGRVSLTVDAVRYEIDKRTRLGVCLDLPRRPRRARRQDQGLCAEGAAFRAAGRSVEADHHDRPRHRHRAVPRFPARAQATKAPGRNWLFFGHQRRDYDFFYEDELVGDARGRPADAAVARLVARRQREIYVQHRMREVGRDLWSWLADGAHVYVCGDALRMAKDVEPVLTEIVAQHSGRTPAEAVKFIAELKAAGRYQADVY